MKVFNKYQISLLKRLADYLETVPKDKFDLESFHEVCGDDECKGFADKNICGTSACAFGWFVTMLKEQNDPCMEFVEMHIHNGYIDYYRVMHEIFDGYIGEPVRSHKDALLDYMFSSRWTFKGLTHLKQNNIEATIKRINNVVTNNTITSDITTSLAILDNE